MLLSSGIWFVVGILIGVVIGFLVGSIAAIISMMRREE